MQTRRVTPCPADRLNLVPCIGALAGAVPAVLVALAQSPTLALWVVLLAAAVQTLDGNLIAPLIQARTVSLPPALQDPDSLTSVIA